MLQTSVAERTEHRPGRRRRQWSQEEKRRIVAETREVGASLASVARRHDVNTNMLFNWRRRLDCSNVGPSAAVGGFVPALLTAPPSPAPASEPRPVSSIEIVLPSGERVIVGADVDAAALGRVLKALARR